MKNSKFKIPALLAGRQNLKLSRSGFTLVEVLVAVFIFALMMTTISGVFAKVVRAHRDAKVIQKSLESAQYAMNLMVKTLRTSSIVDFDESSPNKIRVYDYSQQKCVEYEFSEDDLIYRSGDADDKEACESLGSFLTNSNLIEDSVNSVFFDAVASSNAVGNEAMGKATVSLTISENDKVLHIQSSVSLRDYAQAML